MGIYIRYPLQQTRCLSVVYKCTYTKYIMEMHNKKEGIKGHFNWNIFVVRIFSMYIYAKFVKEIVVYNMIVYSVQCVHCA